MRLFDLLPKRAHGWRLAALVAAAVLWFLAPLWLIGSGVERFDRGPDPRAAAMAHEAQLAAWMHNDNPIGRVLCSTSPAVAGLGLLDGRPHATAVPPNERLKLMAHVGY